MAASAPANDMDLVHWGMGLLCLVGLFVIWHMYHADIIYAAMRWGWVQLGWIDHIVAADAQLKRLLIATATHADKASAAHMVAVLNAVGRYFIVLPLAVTLWGLWRVQRHPASRTRRAITAASLPRIMASHAPAVTPILYYGDLLNTDPEDHRRALSPEEWAQNHALVVNRKLQRDLCRELLVSALGNKVTTPEQLTPVERALFAVFGARLLSDGQDIPKAQFLLDELNRSCHRHRWNGKPGYPDLAICDESFAKYATHPAAAEWIARHPYPRTLLHAMHKEALRTGKLASSHFRWLKGMDRPLWYALNTTGRKAPFVESAAVFTQCLWEEFAFENGYRLQSPCLDAAVDGIEAYLVKAGIVKPLP